MSGFILAALLLQAAAPPRRPAAPGPGAAPVTDVNEEFKIGPEDVLGIFVWQNEALTRTVSVRPDGRISLPLVNDVQAAGLTPLQLRQALLDRYKEFDAAIE